MKQTINKTISIFSVSIFAMLLAAISISAATVVRQGSGANTAALQATVTDPRFADADLVAVRRAVRRPSSRRFPP